MKLFDRSTEIESIALKLLVEEDEEGEYTEDELTCTFDIHGNAIWDNINTIEG